MSKIAILVFIISANNYYIYCQNYSLEFINEKNGLSQSCGHTITQHNDYMWFGTQDGLNRYDGTRIKTFKSKDFPAMGSNYINIILPEDQNRLWIGTTEGLSLMDIEKDKIIAVSRKSLKFVKKLYKDNFGNLWATDQYKGLYKKNSNSDNFEYIKFFDQQKVKGFDEYKGTIYIATTNAIYQFSDSQNIFKKMVLPDKIEKSIDMITSFLISETGDFWLGTFKNGLYKISENNGILSLVNHFTTSNCKLGSNEITCVSEDAKGNVWLGTRASSAFIYVDKEWVALNDFYKSNQFIKGYIFSFYHDIQGITWIGTDGDGIAQCDPSKEKFTNILEQDKKIFDFERGEIVFDINGSGSKIYIGVKDKYILEFDEKTNGFNEFEDYDLNYYKNHPRQMILEGDKIWIGSDKGLRQYNLKEKKYTSLNVPKQVIFIYTICLVGEDELWSGGTEGLTRMNKKDLTILPINEDHPLYSISNLLIRNLYQDKFGKIWIGTVGHGLFCYDPLINSLVEINSNHNLDCNGIRCFMEDKNEMFVGTDCGLYKLDQCFDVIRKVSEVDGLPNDVIYSIEKSKKSGYWLASNAGLTYVQKDFTKFENYNVDDGLPGNEFNTNCSYVSDDGFFYFGGMKGLVKFNENEIKNNSYEALLKVYDIFIDNKVLTRDQWTKDSTVVVEPNQKYLKISLSVSNYSDSKNNHCSYRLKGFNDWQNVPDNNEILFTGLKAGKYNLTVKGYNNDDTPTKNNINLVILVKAPFWQKWWFYLILLFSFGCFLTLWLKKELRTKEKEIRYKSEIDEIKNVALRSQMNPHFIFNCLSAIEYLMISGASDKAQIYLNKFSRLVRNTLDFTNNELVTLKDEITHLNIYIHLENLRFNDTIKYYQNIEININPDLFQFPPLILQPLVENSIKHGFDETIKKPEITLSITIQGKYLVIQITDNGIGISNSKNKAIRQYENSYGLDVTKQRLQMYSRKINKKTEFHVYDLSDQSGQGTNVVLKIEL